MTTPAAAAELKKIIDDTVSAQRAAIINDAVAKAHEEFAKKQEALPASLRGTDDATKRLMREAMGGGDSPAVVEGEEATNVVFGQPGKRVDSGAGLRGLDLARFIKARHAAGAAGDVVAQVKEWAKKDAGYRSFADRLEQRGLTEGSFTGMGALAPNTVAAEFIELLRGQSVVQAMGARELPLGPSGVLDLGKQTGSTTAYYLGEATNITPSQPTVGSLSMKRKKMAALVPVSNELLRNPSVQADAFIRDDLMRVMALKRDLSFIRGVGTEYSPKGIKNSIATANVNAQTATTLAGKVADLMQAISLVDGSDTPMTSPGWLFNPRTIWNLMATLDSNGSFTFMPMLVAGNLFGFKYAKTTQIPKNLGGGTETEVYFGDFSEVLVGFDNQMAIEFFPNGAFYEGSAVVSGISTDQSVMRAMEGHDIVLRHNTSFSMITGVTY